MAIRSTQSGTSASGWTFRPGEQPASSGASNAQAVPSAASAALTKQATMAPDSVAIAVACTTPGQGAQVVSCVAAKNPDAAASVVSDVTKVDPTQAAAVVSKLASNNPKQAKDVVAKVGNQNPGKAAQLMAALAARNPMQAMFLMVGGVAGSAAVSDLGASLAVRNNVSSLHGTVKAIASETPNSDNLLNAAHKTLGSKAEEAMNPNPESRLNALGKLGSGLSALGGLNALTNIENDMKTFDKNKSFDSANALASDALNTVRGANDALKLVKNSPVGFIGTRAVMGLSMAVDATDMVRRVEALHKPGRTTHDRVSDAAFLAGDSIDAVGSGLMATGIGLPVGMGLKLAAAGLAVVGIGAQHINGIKKIAGSVKNAVEKLV